MWALTEIHAGPTLISMQDPGWDAEPTILYFLDDVLISIWTHMDLNLDPAWSCMDLNLDPCIWTHMDLNLYWVHRGSEYL